MPHRALCCSERLLGMLEHTPLLLGQRFEHALDLLQRLLRTCPTHASWHTSYSPVWDQPICVSSILMVMVGVRFCRVRQTHANTTSVDLNCKARCCYFPHGFAASRGNNILPGARWNAIGGICVPSIEWYNELYTRTRFLDGVSVIISSLFCSRERSDTCWSQLSCLVPPMLVFTSA